MRGGLKATAKVVGPSKEGAADWSETLRVDYELSDAAQLRSSHEEDKAML